MSWTLTPSLVAKAGHYLKWKVVCTSDGDALSAIDLLAVAAMPARLKKLIQGSTLMVMKVSPGTGGVIPGTTINVTLADDEGATIFTHDAYSKDADTNGISLSEDFNAYPPVFDKLYLAINDIGNSGVQVTLYFVAWVE